MPISASDVPSSRVFSASLDPEGELDFTIDWSEVLDSGVSISSVTTTLSSSAQTAGLEIISESTSSPTTTVRLGITSSSHDNTAFQQTSGSDLTFKQTMTDSSGQIWEFTFVVHVIEQ